MALGTAAFAVDDSPAVAISSPGTIKSRRKVYVRTESGDDAVYLGPAGVTSTTGVPLLATDLLVPIELGANDTLYAICAAAGTATVHVLTT